MLLIIALVTGFLDLSASRTLNDFEPLKKEFFGKIFAIFGCNAHFNTELRRNG